MTHRHPTTLLEAYVDGDLTAEDTATVQDAIAHCSECRDTIEELRKLKLILKKEEAPDPGDEYWQELTSLIHARTIDRLPIQATEPISPQTRRIFTRAVASFAVALFLFAAAITLSHVGWRNPEFAAGENHPVFVVAPMQDILPSLPDSVFTDDDQLEWAMVILQMGIPGSPGRMIGLQELTHKPI